MNNWYLQIVLVSVQFLLISLMLLTQLFQEWPLPRLQTVYWRVLGEHRWPVQSHRPWYEQWWLSHSPLGPLLLSGLPHTEGLMAAPRWWEGCGTTTTITMLIQWVCLDGSWNSDIFFEYSRIQLESQLREWINAKRTMRGNAKNRINTHYHS